jgi:hypothetical protein
MNLSHSAGTVSIGYASISLTSATHDLSNQRYYRLSNLFGDGGGYFSEVGVQDVFFFNTSGSKTFYLVASEGTGANATAARSSMTLLFVPSIYGSVTSESPGISPQSEYDLLENPDPIPTER